MRNFYKYFLILILLSGCSAEKRALKHIHKAERLSETVPAKYCAERFQPVDSINEKIVYRPGTVVRDTVTDIQIEVVNDTVIKHHTKIITQVKVDTVVTVKYQQVVNKAALQVCTDALDKAHIKLAETKKALSITLWAVIILGTYTLARWILRIWNIKLP